MMSSRPAFPLALRLVAAAGSLSLFAAFTGCAAITAPVHDEVQGASITGSVHGGQQPITGAAIQLYSVGTTGYGTGATALLTSAVTTDTNGAFSITGRYTCPSPATLVYLTATGGNTGAGINTNSKEMLALGACGNLTTSTFVQINEVTTAAAAFALTPYFTQSISPTSVDGFGSPSNAQALVGITNAFTTAATLANISSGTANTSITTNGAGGAVTITPEAAKLNTIADILASCVNSTGTTGSSDTTSNCAVLFADSAPTGVTPVNTLQAAVLLNRNPTSTNANGSSANLTALFGLASATPPFPAQANQPTDWTVGVLYTATPATMALPLGLAIDAGGNVWVVNNGPSSTGGSLNEISPGGSLLVTNTLSATVGGATVNGSTLNPRNVAVDLNGNVWVPTSSSSGIVFEYFPGTGSTTGLAIGKSPYGVAVDASNNVWFSQQSSSATSQYTELLNATNAATSQVGYPTAVAATGNGSSYITFDANGVLWATTAVAASTSVFELTNLSSASCTAFPCTTGTLTYNTVSGFGAQPFGIAPGASTIWTANATGNNISSATITTPTVTNYGSSSTVSTPRFPAVDGSGNVWVSNRGTAAISEYTSGGTLLSPAATSGSTVVGFNHSSLSSGNGIGIDPSGNIWVANNSSGSPNSIFEVVGAASPAVTPLALALKNGTIATKP